ncbi:MAG: hypothetical protein HYY05_03885, partial [Chloroflexi bacterium]|nr:hypothetical protein [Chloroflexota bacterium]
ALAAARSDLATQQHLLQDLTHQAEPFVESVFLTDGTGRLIWDEPPGSADLGPNPAMQPHIREPLANGDRYVSGVHLMGTQGRPTVVLAVPVLDPDGALGAVRSSIMVKMLQEAMRS